MKFTQKPINTTVKRSRRARHQPNEVPWSIKIVDWLEGNKPLHAIPTLCLIKIVSIFNGIHNAIWKVIVFHGLPFSQPKWIECKVYKYIRVERSAQPDAKGKQAAVYFTKNVLINKYGGFRIVKDERGCHVLMVERLIASASQRDNRPRLISLPSLMHQNTENHLSGWLVPTL